ncbi:hypothetical protein Baya_1989 [Bagarius yarrelli]|uniref:Uncharacterized protein n=1 Tax=Bagarius yarrelli TaxID=175774 RepID=A0A556TMP1_BAGYA|nr:hypothetical protein Baya_1989 [Bagarius yarrelli]
MRAGNVCRWDSRQQETLSEEEAQRERRKQQDETDSEYGNDSKANSTIYQRNFSLKAKPVSERLTLTAKALTKEAMESSVAAEAPSFISAAFSEKASAIIH